MTTPSKHAQSTKALLKEISETRAECAATLGRFRKDIAACLRALDTGKLDLNSLKTIQRETAEEVQGATQDYLRSLE